MSEEECSHDCDSCSAKCNNAKKSKASPALSPNQHSAISKVIAVASGKGGVGKSFVTAMLASQAAKHGLKTAILDADVTGPSIPKAFGISTRAEGTEDGITPAISKHGVKIMSLNLLLENVTDPVVWRGPVIAGAIKQFWTDVAWGEIDLMFVDMPPGTGDAPLTVFQSLPVNGAVIVASPQELVSMIVKKAVKMANMMKIPILGLVENMSYFECPGCGQIHEIFGRSKIAELGKAHNIAALSRIPIDPLCAQAVDAGQIEDIWRPELEPVLEAIIKHSA